MRAESAPLCVPCGAVGCRKDTPPRCCRANLGRRLASREDAQPCTSGIVRRAMTVRVFVRRKHRRRSTSAPCSSSSVRPGGRRRRFEGLKGICSSVGTPVWVGSPEESRTGDIRAPSSQEPTGQGRAPVGHRIAANNSAQTAVVSIKRKRRKPQPLVHLVTLPPRHFASPANAEKCYLCAGNELLPLCQEGHPLIATSVPSYFHGTKVSTKPWSPQL
jgi:hypothetical protein